MVMDNVIAQNAVMILLQSNLYLQPPLHNRYFFVLADKKNQSIPWLFIELITTVTWHGDGGWNS